MRRNIRGFSKKQRKQLQVEKTHRIQQEHKRDRIRKIIGGIMIGSSTFMIPFGNVYFGSTFIELYKIILMGLAVFLLVLWAMTKSVIFPSAFFKNKLLTPAFFALTFCFGFLMLNTEVPFSEKVYYEQHTILDRGEGIRSKGGSCKPPFVTILRNGIEKTLDFRCPDNANVWDKSYLNIKVQRGCLGFDVVVSKKLIR
ncbi:hypothetical protein [Algivirga pacifica]|uniref:Uncharacterized protein n=1 Tax=Algivirga pacifica TaxID=1162670 RepID=A0ABP9DCX5_9BACT